MSRVSIFCPPYCLEVLFAHMNVDVKFLRFAEISLIMLIVQFGFLLESIDAISSLLFDTKHVISL